MNSFMSSKTLYGKYLWKISNRLSEKEPLIKKKNEDNYFVIKGTNAALIGLLKIVFIYFVSVKESHGMI